MPIRIRCVPLILFVACTLLLLCCTANGKNINLANECPEGYERHESQCWNTTATPYVYVQNKFVEDYLDDFEFQSAYFHKVVLHLMSGDSLDTPLVNVSVTLRPAYGEKEPVEATVLDLYSGRARRHVITDTSPLTAYSDVFGKVYISIKPSDSKLRVPALYAQTPFMPVNEYMLIKPDSAFFHQLLHITQHKLKKLFSFNSGFEKVKQAAPPFLSESAMLEAVGVKKNASMMESKYIYKPVGVPVEEEPTKAGSSDSVDDVAIAMSRIIPNMVLPLLMLPGERQSISGLAQHYKRSINGHEYPRRAWQNARVRPTNSYERATNLLDCPIVNINDEISGKSDDAMEKLVTRMPASWSVDFGPNASRLRKRCLKENSCRLTYRENIQSHRIWKREFAASEVVAVTPRKLGGLLESAERVEVFFVSDSAQPRNLSSSGFGDLSRKRRGVLKTFAYVGNQIWSSVVESAQDAHEMVSGMLRKLGIAIKRLYRTLVSLYNWNDVISTANFVEMHLLRMPGFLERNYLRSTDGVKSWVHSKLTITPSKLGSSGVSALVNATGKLSNLDDRVFTENATMLDLKAVRDGLINSDPAAHRHKSKFSKRSLDASHTVNLVHESSGKVIKSVVVSPDMQASFLRDRVAADFVNNPETVHALLVEEQDQKAWKDIFASIGQNLDQLKEQWNNETVNREVQALKDEFKEGMMHMRVGSIMRAGRRLLSLQSGVLFESMLVIIRTTIHGFISVCDKIMRTHVKLPWITRFYEKVLVRGNSQLTLYGLVSLLASLELDFLWKMFRLDDKPILSREEISLLVGTSNPSNYIRAYKSSALMREMALESPEISPTRFMRERLSYIMGSVQALGRTLSSLLMLPNFFLQGIQLTKFTTMRIPLQLPFEFVGIMSNFAFAWKYGIPREFSELPNSTRYYVWSLSWIRPILLVMRIPWLPVAFFTDIPRYTLANKLFWSAFDISEVVISVFEGIYETRLLRIGTEHTLADYSDVVFKAVDKVMFTIPWLFQVWKTGSFVAVSTIAFSMHLAAIASEHLRLVASIGSGAIYH